MSDVTADTMPIPDRRGNLTEGPVKDHLVRLSVPMTWGILVMISFQLVDTFYISLLGTAPLAAISFTFPVTMAIFSVTMGFSIAMSSVLSRLIGAGNSEVTRRVTTHGLMLAFLVSAAVGLIGYHAQDHIFILLGASEDMRPLIREYMTPWFAGAVFVSLPMVGNSAIRAAGDARLPAMIMTLAALLNIVLAPMMIFGLAGFPRMELEGAACATVFANMIAMLAGLYVIHCRKKMTDLSFLYRLKDFGDSARRVLFIALPVGLTQAILPVLNAFMVYLLSTSGHAAVAAYGIVARVEAFAFIILMGVAVGMGPIIGQNFGAHKFGRVNETIGIAIRFSVAWSLFVAIILGGFGHAIAGIFSDEQDVIHYVTLFFWIVPFSYIFSNLLRGWGSAFNAMGMPQRSFTMIAAGTLCMVPAVYMGHEWGGVPGLFIAIAAVNIITGIGFHAWSWRACRRMEGAGVSRA